MWGVTEIPAASGCLRSDEACANIRRATLLWHDIRKCPFPLSSNRQKKALLIHLFFSLSVCVDWESVQHPNTHKNIRQPREDKRDSQGTGAREERTESEFMWLCRRGKLQFHELNKITCLIKHKLKKKLFERPSERAIHKNTKKRWNQRQEEQRRQL